MFKQIYSNNLPPMNSSISRVVSLVNTTGYRHELGESFGNGLTHASTRKPAVKVHNGALVPIPILKVVLIDFSSPLP